MKMQDRELVQAWRKWLTLLLAAETLFYDENECPPPFLRETAIREFCKRFDVLRIVVVDALDAWERADSGTVH
jgi:hypothetical protein